MQITIQSFEDCPNLELLDQRLAEALHGRTGATIIHQHVETHEEAVRLGFHGSPTILIDGVDPFADEQTPVGLACRVYRGPDGPAGSPTVAQLSSVLDSAPAGSNSGEAITGPLSQLPIACTLTPDTGREQIGRWRAFDGDYLLDAKRTDDRLVVHYAKVGDATRRLRDLVAVESACCSFVEWAIDESNDGLRLVVTGTPEQLAALVVGHRARAGIAQENVE